MSISVLITGGAGYLGDIILLVSGGHDFLMLEDTEMIEVKQGPYAGDDDKERFKGKK